MAMLVMAACGGSTSAVTQATPSQAAQTTPTPPSLKPALGGLLDRDGPTPTSYLSAMGGFVVNVHWADIQRSPQGDVEAGNAIDQAISQLHQIDPSGLMGLKIRLFAGIYAPEWAKSLGGSPIPVADPASGASGTIGRFWTADFGAAYSDLMTKLAARYDAAPEVREITISRCTTVYAEPFIRDAANPFAVTALLAAGFTVASDHQCHRDEILSHQVWAHTHSDLSFNPYQIIDGTGHSDEAFTEDMMGFCRSTLGPRCVLANNSLRVPLQYPQMYGHIQALGPPIAFQTAVMAKVGNLGETLDTAIALGAESVELPAGFQVLSISVLAAYDARLKAAAAT
jgi:hypothetical protein